MRDAISRYRVLNVMGTAAWAWALNHGHIRTNDGVGEEDGQACMSLNNSKACL